jgi:alpha-tubulin suppressor-like RCC1 family protein
MTTTCARRANGEVACWGSLVGTASSLPLPVAGLTDVAEVAVGGGADAFYACALKADGTVWCWGGNNSGQCGTGERSNENIETPVQVAGLEGVVQVALGYSTGCARLESGKVSCWGSDYNEALGNGDGEDSYAPVEVPRLARVTHLAGYGYNFCAVTANKLQCWGDNSEGQIGNGKADREAPAASPTAAAGVSNVALADTGWGTTCAVQKNGKAMCWGANAFGQTGHNEAETDYVTRGWAVLNEQDETVKGFGGYVIIDCGRNFCCGLHVDGHISCMGSTPINGGDDFFGVGVSRSTFPIAAGGIQFAPPAPVAAE